MKKQIMALAMMVTVSLLCYAQGAVDYPWLTFTLTDNSEVSVPSENLQLTYAAGNLQLTSATVDQTLPLSSLKSMRFESEQVGIEGVEADANSSVDVFNLKGVKIGVFTSIEGAVSSLPHGAYIIRAGKTSKKVMF